MVSRREFLKYSALTVPAAQLAACGGGGDGSPAVVEWPIATDVYTTAEQQICLVGLAPTTPPINANDLPYSRYGYNAWKAQSGPQARQAANARPGLHRRAERRAAAEFLFHLRPAHHRQGIAGAAALLRLERAVWRPVERRVGLFAGDRLDAARPRRCHPDGQRPAQENAVRFRHLARRRRRQHPVQRAALVHRCPRRQGHHAQLRRSSRRRQRRLSASVQGGRAQQRNPVVPGDRQPRPVLEGFGVREREDAWRRTWVRA